MVTPQTHDAAWSWFLDEWSDSDFSVAVLEGFAGVGKSTLARRVYRAWNGPKVMVNVAPGSRLEDLTFDIASALEDSGDSTIADSSAPDFASAIDAYLRGDNLLIVIDDFQEAVAGDSSVEDVQRFVGAIARRSQAGRVLLVSNQSLADHPWLSSATFRTLAHPRPDEGRALLSELLRERDLDAEIPESSLGDVAAWLGQNPRAMRAFVACLVGQSFDEIIDIDRESWDLRDGAPSPDLVQRLEIEFWTKTLGRLGIESLALAENLSVFRKPFRVEAIAAAGGGIGNWEKARDELRTAFLLDRDQRYYELNPVVQKLTLAKLASKHRRKASAHSRAANYFSKRIGVTTPRDVVRSGAAFVEAKHHFSKAEMPLEAERISHDFRRTLLANFRSASFDLTDENQVREFTPVLLAALRGTDLGYSSLRATLVQMLVARGFDGDAVLALEHARVAILEDDTNRLWMTTVRLAGQLETELFLRNLARLAHERLVLELAIQVACAVGEELFVRGRADLAMETLEHAIQIPLDAQRDAAGDRVVLGLDFAFMLDRVQRTAAGIDFLIESFDQLKDLSTWSYRLLEDAALLGYQAGDRDTLQRIAELPSHEQADGPRLLAQILQLLLAGDYREAIRVGQARMQYPTVAVQVAFSWLVLGDPHEARRSLSMFSAMNITNPARAWLTAVVALCCRDADTYSDAMAMVLHRSLTASEESDPRMWLLAWDSIPDRHVIFPAFQFPRLPTELTQLSHVLVRRGGRPSPLDPTVTEQVRLPVAITGPAEPRQPGVSSIGIDATGAAAIHVYAGEARSVSGDTYQNFGQVGAMGSDASARDFTQLNASSMPELVAAMKIMLDAARKDGADDVATALEGALAESDSQDTSRVLGRLRAISTWIGDKVGDLGVGVSAAILAKALGF